MRGVNGAAQGIKGALKFQARVRVLAAGGKTTVDKNQLSVTRRRLGHAADRRRHELQELQGRERRPGGAGEGPPRRGEPEVLRGPAPDHVAEHQRLFRRVALDLGTTDAAKRPTDERIQNFAAGNDPQLAALYFQFGRYLLISCSRPGGQPANLQGLWNESMNPPWGSKYTININTEMNYWPAEPTQPRRVRRAADRRW